MNIVSIDKDRILNGLVVRTKNANERDPSSSKIDHLWDKFFKEVAPSLVENAMVYGVYTNYESDASGEFDVMACTDKELSGLSRVTLQRGDYLIFSGKGEMPQIVIDTWGEIWNYFSNKDVPYERAYLTDYELYKNKDEIEIYIGIK